MSLGEYAGLSLFLLVVINPVSKIAVVTALSELHTKSELRGLSREACFVGFVLLVVFAFAGKYILHSVFHIQLHSVQFAGGFAIFLTGIRALRVGRFFSVPNKDALRAIGAAPIGMPMIAGPAAIAAVISATQPAWTVSLAIVPGMGVNLAFMLIASSLGPKLRATRLLGPLVRITGLFLSAIGAEMIFSSVSTWLSLSAHLGG